MFGFMSYSIVLKSSMAKYHTTLHLSFIPSFIYSFIHLFIHLYIYIYFFFNPVTIFHCLLQSWMTYMKVLWYFVLNISLITRTILEKIVRTKFASLTTIHIHLAKAHNLILGQKRIWTVALKKHSFYLFISIE